MDNVTENQLSVNHEKKKQLRFAHKNLNPIFWIMLLIFSFIIIWQIESIFQKCLT